MVVVTWLQLHDIKEAVIQTGGLSPSKLVVNRQGFSNIAFPFRSELEEAVASIPRLRKARAPNSYRNRANNCGGNTS